SDAVTIRVVVSILFSLRLPPSTSTLFPYTTLFRSFIGAFAKNPRYQGGGSSHINSFRVTGALEAAEGMADITYAEGYGLEKDERSEEHTSELQSRFDLVCRLLLEKKKIEDHQASHI